MTAAEPRGYVMDNSAPSEHDRLRRLEQWADPSTTSWLAGLGVAPGWRCLEVGAGAGSVARWLAQRVAPAGLVVATDLDVRLLAPGPNLEVRRHDVTTDPLPGQDFDLVHARLVTEHLPDRSAVLRLLAASLRPGGWLMIEALESGGVAADPGTGSAALFTDCSARLLKMLGQLGVDACYGRRLASELTSAGLEAAGLAGLAGVARGGGALASFWRMTWQQLAGIIVSSGTLDTEELGAYLALHDEPGFSWIAPSIIAGWGRAVSAA